MVLSQQAGRQTMQYDGPSFWQHLTSDSSLASVAGMLDQFHSHEQQCLHEGQLLQPYYFWPKQPGLKDLTTALSDKANGADVDLETKVRTLGICMRMVEQTYELAAGLENALSLDQIETLSQAAQFELCLIFQAHRRWGKLRLVCQKARRSLVQDDPRLAIVCDLSVLANYRLTLKPFLKGELTPNGLEQFKTTVAQNCRFARKFPKNGFIYRGILHHLKGQHSQALAAMVKSQSEKGYAIPLFRAADLYRPLEQLTPSDPEATLKDRVVLHMRHVAGKDGCLLVSSNDLYFQKYAASLLESFGKTNPSGVIHWHFINHIPDVTQLDRFEKKYDVRINYTVDTSPDEKEDPNTLRGYYAGARYIFLPLYLSTYRQVTISDVDGVVRAPLAALWQDDGQDMLITSQLTAPDTPCRVGWEAIAAGSLAIRNSNAARQLANSLSNYLLEAFREASAEQKSFFYSDQVGLFMCFMIFFDQLEIGRMGDFFSQAGAWSFGDHDKKEDWQKNKLANL